MYSVNTACRHATTPAAPGRSCATLESPIDVARVRQYGRPMPTAVSPRPKRRSSYGGRYKSDIFTRYQRSKVRSRRYRRFIESECLVPTGRGLGKPYRLRPTHRVWLREAFDYGALTTLVSGPRGMGKTGWMAAVAVAALFDIEGADIIIASTSLRQAMKAYGRAVRIIETSGRMTDEAMVYRNKADPYVEIPTRGSTLRPLPAEEKYIVGESPSTILVDEIGYVDRDTYEAMQTSLGKADDATLVGFGTPGLGVIAGDGEPNVMYQLREQTRGESPPADLRYVEHAARTTDDPADKRSWKRANPLLGDLVDPRAVALDLATMPPARFGQMRLGLWTQHESAWMPLESWDALDVDTSELEEGAVVALGFDGSIRRDSTALVAYEASRGRLVVLGHWTGARDGPAIPRGDVMAAIDRAFTRYNVVAMYADPWHWRSEIEELAERLGDRVLEWNTASIRRMAPASDAFMAAVMLRELTWDGTPAMRSHVLAAVAKRTSVGDIIARDARRPLDTDLATAGILAYEASRSYVEPVKPAIY